MCVCFDGECCTMVNVTNPVVSVVSNMEALMSKLREAMGTHGGS